MPFSAIGVVEEGVLGGEAEFRGEVAVEFGVAEAVEVIEVFGHEGGVRSGGGDEGGEGVEGEDEFGDLWEFDADGDVEGDIGDRVRAVHFGSGVKTRPGRSSLGQRRACVSGQIW